MAEYRASMVGETTYLFNSLIFSRVCLVQFCFALPSCIIMTFLLKLLCNFQLEIDLRDPVVQSKGLHSHFIHVSALHNEQLECKPGLAILCGNSIRDSSNLLDYHTIFRSPIIPSPVIKRSKNAPVFCC